MHQVQMEFIPGNPTIWVARLTPEDPTYEFYIETEAQVKATELKAADPTERLYRVMDLSIIQEEPPTV
jgi:hypothetical protein